jgi:hypothetical protein
VGGCALDRVVQTEKEKIEVSEEVFGIKNIKMSNFVRKSQQQKVSFHHFVFN